MTRSSRHFLSLSLSLALAPALAACGDASDPIPGDSDSDSGADDTDGDPDGGSTGDDSDGDPSGGDPSGGDPTGDDPPDDDPPDDDPTGGTTGDDTGPDVDVEPPTILSMSPADGEAGVLADAVLLVKFSEPMNKTATQAAYQSADIPAGEVTFAWNAAGDELTITPNDYLEWSLVENIDDPAKEYAWMITTVAEDLAGNSLEEQKENTFTTMRGYTMWMLPNVSLSGYRTSAGLIGSFGDGDPMYMGDSGAQGMVNGWYYGFVTFDFSQLPAQTIGIGAAVLGMNHSINNNDPYGGLGGLIGEQVSYTQLDGNAMEQSPLSDMGIVSTSINPNLIEIEVTDEVAGEFAADEFAGNAQFRFRFEKSSDNDDMADAVRVDEEDVAMLVTIAYP